MMANTNITIKSANDARIVIIELPKCVKLCEVQHAFLGVLKLAKDAVSFLRCLASDWDH